MACTGVVLCLTAVSYTHLDVYKRQVKCTGVDKNADGSIAAIHCTADLETGNGNPADGRKVKGRCV